jgi:aspartate 1-decarboxylase
MDAVGLTEFEKVEVFDIQNGARFETYVIEGERGSGIIGVNGAAARLVHLHDEVIIVNYAWLTREEMAIHTPQIIIAGEDNKSYIVEPVRKK